MKQKVVQSVTKRSFIFSPNSLHYVYKTTSLYLRYRPTLREYIGLPYTRIAQKETFAALQAELSFFVIESIYAHLFL